jgi:hypothetical protein
MKEADPLVRAGERGLEPLKTESESAVLPITPLPKECPLRSTSSVVT